ncbi:hypothetical protein RvY_03483 [Ramazzottius varieornatus]|uniref:Uncharacterized protein n=1 Tax=Ramazzottius varieornatus TaxID=947166 RepID=A0A1D1URZ6_RAMVA|nr:hypothetical protein RvY_03483 [Ramazzottius varieornatus]
MIRAGILDFDDRYNNHEEHAPQGTTDVQRSTKNEVARRRTGGCPVLDMRKAFLLATDDINGPELALDMSRRWVERVPDAIVSFVSGTQNFRSWKRDDFRSEFQTGFINLLGNLDLLVIDDGLDYGISRLVATAAKREEMFRDYLIDSQIQQGHRKPFVQYIGFVPLTRVAERTGIARTGNLNEAGTTEIAVKVVPTPGITENSGFGISPYRSHYLLLDKKYDDAGFLRVDIEKQLQNELGARLAESEGDVHDGAVPFVPHIIFFFQGELDELDRIRAYVQLRTPVVVMDKCGGMADILAFAVSNSAEPDRRRTRSSLATRLARSFPELQANEGMKFDYVDKILEIVEAGAGKEGKLLYVADCSRLDTFTSLDKTLLQALINSSAEKNATPDQANRNFKLCIQLNQPEVASSLLLDCSPWNKLPAKVPYSAMLSALMAPNREAFVDLLLRQKFPLRFFTSHLDLLLLFQKANGRDLFVSYIWDNILGHSQTEPVREDFILRELNPLIQQLTGIKNFLDLHEMSRIALTRDDTVADPVLADANSLRALVVFGVLFHRPALLKVLLKYASDPIPLCVIIESLYRGIYRHINNEELHDRLKKQADEFGAIATDILDLGIKESPLRARSFFLRGVAEANNKTTLEMAFDARNKKFIGHQTIQTWLDQFSFNFVRVKGSLPTLKLLLSAYLIFPMFFWLSFPSQREEGKGGSRFGGVKEDEYLHEPRSLEEKKSHLAALDRTNLSYERGQAKKQKEYRPSLPAMLLTVWSAPIVKFTTWFLIYLAFLVVLGVDMMLPSCTNIGVDIAVFIITVLIWLELVTRTIGDILLKHSRVGWTLRAVDILFQTVWIIIFFLYRIAPFRYEHPFTGRVILAFGVMYYYYSIWTKFYPINRMIGPFTRLMNVMWRKDVTKWLILMTPLFVSTGVIWQALITPDYPFTGEDWRRAFYRSTFTIFGAFYNELEYNPQCERTSRINYNNFTQPNTAYPVDRCWLGDYTDYTCNTVSFWSYFFVIQYYFLLKLGMMVILMVFFIFRMMAERPKVDLVWSYYRFKLLLEYHLRSILPFPLSIIGNLWTIVQYFVTNKGHRIQELAPLDVESDVKMDTFIYWKHKANLYLTQKSQQAAAQGIPKQQNALLGTIKGDVQSLLAKVKEMDKKLSALDDNAKDAHSHVQNTARFIQREEG